MMEMQSAELAPGVAKVTLVGRLDAARADKIDLRFNAIAGANRRLLVDMALVDFLASIGIRTLLLGAKTMQRRGGQLILVSPQPDVIAVLEVTGILDLLPVATTMAEAEEMLAA